MGTHMYVWQAPSVPPSTRAVFEGNTLGERKGIYCILSNPKIGGGKEKSDFVYRVKVGRRFPPRFVALSPDWPAHLSSRSEFARFDQ